MHARFTRGYSHIAVTAALSLAGLIVVAGWVWGGELREKRSSLSARMPASDTLVIATPQNEAWKEELVRAGIIATTSPDVVAEEPSNSFTDQVFSELLSTYVGLKQQGTYTPELADSIARNIAQNSQVTVVFAPITEAEVRVDQDISYERMLAYRDDLRVSTEPLMKNSEPEFSVFAKYVETRNTAYLDELRTVAERYHEAAKRTKNVIAPRDAVTWHVSIVNSLNEFAAVLDAMTRFADDPIASIALLRAYNTAERHLIIAFDSLSGYYATKQP